MSQCATKSTKVATDPKKETQGLPQISEKTKEHKKSKGLFSVWTKENSCLWELQPQELKQQYLWLCNQTTGIGSGILSGSMGPVRVIEFKRQGNILLMQQIQTRFMADPQRPESRGLADNFAPVVLARLPVVAEEGETFLVDAIDLLKNYPFESIRRIKNRGQYSRPKDGTRIIDFKSYPLNLAWDLEVDLAAQKSPQFLKEAPLPDSYNLTLGLHFSLSKLPETDYQPRRADFRVGYFTTSRQDVSQPESVDPMVEYIHRWNLTKKNPDQKKSEVVEPIVFWITNNTPYEYRDLIKEAVLEWNKAFEKLGFLKAIDCQIQPDEAQWHVGDYRYNVIQWLTSNTIYFSGHGPVRVNPLTGEILRAHIRLEGESFHGFDQLAAHIGGSDQSASCSSRCDLMHTQQDLLVWGDLLASWGQPLKKKEVIRQWLRKVVMHEVGHTLGLRHNFRASMMLPFEKLHDRSWVAKNGLTGSIMEYMGANIHPDSSKQGYYFSPTLGAYDYWAIAYGYTPTTSKNQKDVLKKILKEALPYGTDEDAGQDPYTQRFDYTDQPLKNNALYRKALEKGLETLKPTSAFGAGDGSRLRKTFSRLVRNWYNSRRFSSRFLGGQIHSRHLAQDRAPVLEWVDPQTEQLALKDILEPLSSSKHLITWQKKLDDLQPNRDWNWRQKLESITFFFERFAKKLHRLLIESALSTNVLNRLLEHSFRQATPQHLTPNTLLESFEKTLVNRNNWDHWARINLDLFVDQLIKLSQDKNLNSESRYLSEALLKRIEKQLESLGYLGKDPTAKAFQEGILRKIQKFFEP